MGSTLVRLWNAIGFVAPHDKSAERRARGALSAMIFGLHVIASAAQEPERIHVIPFFPSASDAYRDGLARVINHSGEAGEVRIEGFDEEGEFYGAVMLSVDAGEAVHFNSEDLESGAAEKGLSGAIGPGEGAWRLQLSSERDIEVLSYFRTADGFLTAMHDTVAHEGGVHRVAFFNPGSNYARRSVLRLVNPGEEAAAVSIVGIDGRGESPGSEVTTTISARASRTFTAAALESGGEGFEGALGDGEGKWRLAVQSAQPLVVMSLLSDPTGRLSNLSTAPGRAQGSVHAVHFLPSASAALRGRSGFARVVNHSGEAGEVRIDAVDDEGETYGPVVLSVDAGEAVQFSSEDLESGNAEQGLSGATGPGEGDWRLELTSERDIEVLSYVRTADGLLTAMHDMAPSEGGRHRVAFFNPASNHRRASVLRLVNPGEEAAAVSIAGVDDRGESPGSEVTTTIPAGASRTFTAAALESGDEGLEGALDDGEGKWRLLVQSAQPLVVMSLLSDLTGHLSNLSTAPGRESQARPDLVVEPPSVSNRSPVAGQTFSLSATVRNDGGADSPVTALRYYRSSDATITATDRALGTDAVAGLSASGSASASVTVSAPSTPGRYYYGACVDAVAEEFNTANNCSAAVEVNVRESESESEGQPDLMVASPRVSDDRPAAEETTFILSVKVSNAGDGASPAAMMRYHRSSDSTITPSDTPAGTDEAAELGASGSDAQVGGADRALHPRDLLLRRMRGRGGGRVRHRQQLLGLRRGPGAGAGDRVAGPTGAEDPCGLGRGQSGRDLHPRCLHPVGDGAQPRGRGLPGDDVALLPLAGRDHHDLGCGGGHGPDGGAGRFGEWQCVGGAERPLDPRDVLLRRVRGYGGGGVRHHEQLLGLAASRGAGPASSAEPGGRVAFGER